MIQSLLDYQGQMAKKFSTLIFMIVLVWLIINALTFSCFAIPPPPVTPPPATPIPATPPPATPPPATPPPATPIPGNPTGTCSTRNGQCLNDTGGTGCGADYSGACVVVNGICTCVVTRCGNDIIEPALGEQCDPPYGFDAPNQCGNQIGATCDQNCNCVYPQDSCASLQLCSGNCIFNGVPGICTPDPSRCSLIVTCSDGYSTPLREVNCNNIGPTEFDLSLCRDTCRPRGAFVDSCTVNPGRCLCSPAL